MAVVTRHRTSLTKQGLRLWCPCRAQVSAEVVWPSGRAGVAGTHLIDTLLMITGQRAVAVSGTASQPAAPVTLSWLPYVSVSDLAPEPDSLCPCDVMARGINRAGMVDETPFVDCRNNSDNAGGLGARRLLNRAPLCPIVQARLAARQEYDSGRCYALQTLSRFRARLMWTIRVATERSR